MHTTDIFHLNLKAMASIDIDIEDYIDEISDYYLIKELKRRADNGNQKAKDAFKEAAKEIIKEEEKESGWPEIKTVLDQLKQDWVNENWERITP